jgi:hypothetical protein
MGGVAADIPEDRRGSAHPVTASLRLPRMLGHAVSAGLEFEVEGSTVREALADLFEKEPGLRSHLVDEQGEIRPHVSVFVDGMQGSLETTVTHRASVRILHAVSGGSPVQASAGDVQDRSYFAPVDGC